ncbi:MAG: DUF4377 domain-containing protein [Phocaeicola sp.]|uniref:DUF4377 domain-containing protein n=1 Tax=Phocaeicola TaxID=909656 RepID=UPI00234F48B1|nr:DUF4377 domain-containing protein [Phocaeicola oris]
MKKHISLTMLSLLLISFLSTSCNKDEEIEAYGNTHKVKNTQTLTLSIEPEYYLSGVVLNNNYLIPIYKGHNINGKIDDVYSFTKNEISGFDYEEGYNYTIKVKQYNIIDAPMDASSAIYRLKKVISKDYVGINKKDEQIITLEIPDKPISIQVPRYRKGDLINVFPALVKETGEIINLIQGEIIGLTQKPYTTYIVKVSKIPTKDSVNPFNLNPYRFRLIEVLSEKHLSNQSN